MGKGESDSGRWWGGREKNKKKKRGTFKAKGKEFLLLLFFGSVEGGLNFLKTGCLNDILMAAVALREDSPELDQQAERLVRRHQRSSLYEYIHR